MRKFDMLTYRYPRTLEEAFGPGEGGPVLEPEPTPMDCQDKIVMQMEDKIILWMAPVVVLFIIVLLMLEGA